MSKNTIYVSKLGNDSNNGTLESPLYSLKKAVETVGEGTIYVREGRYNFNETLEIIGKKNITIMPYESEKVYFDGGVVVPNDRIKKLEDESVKARIINKDVIKDVYEADLSGLGIDLVKYQNIGFGRCEKAGPSELYINAQPQNVVMYPKKDEKPYKLETIECGSYPAGGEFDMRKPVIAFAEDRCVLWKDAKEAAVTGIFAASFAHDTISIEKIDVEKREITLCEPHYFCFSSEPTFQHWKVLNILEEISEKGEYYIDCENVKLYFIPSVDIKDALIEISSLGDTMIAIENSENIVIDGFVIENGRYSGVYMEAGRDCLVKNCVIRNIGTIGVQIGKGFAELEDGKVSENIQPEEKAPKLTSRRLGSFKILLYHYAAMEANGGKNNGVDHCEIYGIGSGGVILNGGDRKTLDDAGNFVTNCKIYDANRLDKTYKAGIHVLGCGNKIAHCELFDMPGFAVYLHGNNHIIEYNDIYNSVTEVADAGAFYMGRDVSEVGNIIRYNHFHDLKPSLSDAPMGVCALYFDDYCVFNQVYGNYFTNIDGGSFSTIFWNRGCETSVSNNVFCDCVLPIRPHVYTAKGVRKEMLRDGSVIKMRIFAKEDDYSGVDITSEAYQKAYPYLYALYKGDFSSSTNIWNNIVVKNKKNDFVDYENGDLTLSDKSSAFFWPQPEVYDTVLGIEDGEIWFEKIKFNEIGIQK